MSIVVFAGLITGLINVAIAGAKNRSLVGWFFAGALLGLIGILICATQPALPDDQAG